MKIYVKAETEQRFYDRQYDEVVTLSQLRAEYDELVEMGEIERESFDRYLRNLLSANGTLKEI